MPVIANLDSQVWRMLGLDPNLNVKQTTGRAGEENTEAFFSISVKKSFNIKYKALEVKATLAIRQRLLV